LSRTDIEHAVISRASQRGVAIDGLEHYRAAADDGRAGLVIGYGRPPEHAYTTAVARLCAALPGQDRTGTARRT
jgi:GntR family transcriptional regulator / MocR family aminotransferase